MESLSDLFAFFPTPYLGSIHSVTAERGRRDTILPCGDRRMSGRLGKVPQNYGLRQL